MNLEIQSQSPPDKWVRVEGEVLTRLLNLAREAQGTEELRRLFPYGREVYCRKDWRPFEKEVEEFQGQVVGIYGLSPTSGLWGIMVQRSSSLSTLGYSCQLVELVRPKISGQYTVDDLQVFPI